MSDDQLDKMAADFEAANAPTVNPDSGDSKDEKKSEAKPEISEAERRRYEQLKGIYDIPLRVTVELGRTKMPVSELLDLTQGSVIELAKLAGEPMEVYVNDKMFAKGEAVVVNDKFGVRLTDIISKSERVGQLGPNK